MKKRNLQPSSTILEAMPPLDLNGAPKTPNPSPQISVKKVREDKEGQKEEKELMEKMESLSVKAPPNSPAKKLMPKESNQKG